MPAGRESYGARQAAFLDALRGAAPVPPGFDPDDVGAAGTSLQRKRARAVIDAWPALCHGLGDRFEPPFAAFAREQPPPASGEGFADGFAFASTLDPDLLTEPARIELFFARAVLVRRGDGGRHRRGGGGAGGRHRRGGGGVRPRRGLYLAIHILREHRRVLIVLHLPGGANGHLMLPPA